MANLEVSGRQTSRQVQPPRKPNKAQLRQQKRKRGHDDLQKIEAAIADLDPKTGTIKTFADLSSALSSATSSGLQASHFTTMTEIQQHAIPLGLKGHDILGAAKTGSGKTLAFLVPVLEKLHRAQWTELDGLGALILSPTRELAVQIFEVLRKIGRHHPFSAGLVIGGKSLKEEAERLDRMNILVCTPGRMLQHLDQTAGFDANNLQILVLDEADRIMDLGFKAAVDALVEHLPRERQTLMFSATQSKKVSDLARLSLTDPSYVSVHRDASAATPTSLQQHYIVTPLPEKLDTLYGFLKANVKSKIIVFLSSGKQVRFVYESFRHLQPGIPLLHLHGRQKQVARLEITSRFAAAKQACLFATDVVARGIDFPAVDWVIQADCPEDADTYIHRVGRTARYESNGRAVLFLDPSEEDGMLRRLEQRRIPIAKVNVKEKKKKSVRNNLQNMCFQFPDLKYLGQKAFISYTRSIYLQRDKDVFHFDELDLDAFAASLGLPGTPLIKFNQGEREDVKRIKNAPRQAMSSDSESDMDLDGPKKGKPKPQVRTKYDRMFERTNQDVLSSHYSKLVVTDASSKPKSNPQRGEGEDEEKEKEEEDDDDDFLSVKRRLNDADLDAVAGNAPLPSGAKALSLGGGDLYVVDSKRREKALSSKKKMLKFMGTSSKLVFDDEGVAHEAYELVDDEGFREQGPAEVQRRKFLAEEGERVKEADEGDKAAAKMRKREKREKRRARELAELQGGEVRGPEIDGDGGREDPLALLRSLPIAGRRDDSEQEEEKEEEEEREEEERPAKKAKKWFQVDSEEEGKKKKEKKKGGKGRVIEVEDEPETLEDLEALAAGLLDT